MILVSACLCGHHCRYDGQSKPNAPLMARLNGDEILPVCPEQLGGLPTPRPACRLAGGTGADVLAGRARVIDRFGVDRTDAFVQGAWRTLALAKAHGVGYCCLKAKSPSCGSATFSSMDARLWPKGYRPVLGVTAALLMDHGIEVEEIP